MQRVLGSCKLSLVIIKPRKHNHTDTHAGTLLSKACTLTDVYLPSSTQTLPFNLLHAAQPHTCCHVNTPQSNLITSLPSPIRINEDYSVFPHTRLQAHRVSPTSTYTHTHTYTQHTQVHTKHTQNTHTRTHAHNTHGQYPIRRV